MVINFSQNDEGNIVADVEDVIVHKNEKGYFLEFKGDAKAEVNRQWYSLAKETDEDGNLNATIEVTAKEYREPRIMGPRGSKSAFDLSKYEGTLDADNFAILSGLVKEARIAMLTEQIAAVEAGDKFSGKLIDYISDPETFATLTAKPKKERKPRSDKSAAKAEKQAAQIEAYKAELAALRAEAGLE